MEPGWAHPCGLSTACNASIVVTVHLEHAVTSRIVPALLQLLRTTLNQVASTLVLTSLDTTFCYFVAARKGHLCHIATIDGIAIVEIFDELPTRHCVLMTTTKSK